MEVDMESDSLENLKRFFFPKEQVLNHWYAPVDNFQCVTADFYQMIEKQLTDRKVPGLTISHVELGEGGLLSAKREYLRLQRERLVFDICAAPFGTSYFFSFRFVELPLGIKAGELFVFIVGLFLVSSLFIKLFGLIYGMIAMLAIVGGSIWIMRNVLSVGPKDFDASLLKTPIIGPLYEMFFREETYYREDTRLMYLSTVDFITKALVDEVTAAKGIKLVRRYERKSIMGDLYREASRPEDDKPLPIPTAA
jgi:uncharacterized membrane protein